MATKLKNFKYLTFIKFLMFILALATVFSATFFTTKVAMNYDENGYSIIKAYDEKYGTDYYTPYHSVQLSLKTTINSENDIEKIKKDKGESSIQDVLHIPIQKYVDKGVRFVLVDDKTDKIIGTDGITSMNLDYNNIDNPTLSKKYITLGSYEEGFTAYIFYNDEVTNNIISFENQNNAISTEYIYYTIGCGLILLLTLVYFGVVSGKKSYDSKVKYFALDRIYFDVLSIFIFSLLAITCVFYEVTLTENLTLIQQYINMGAVSLIITTLLVFYFSNFGKKIKDRNLLNSISFVAFSKFIYKKLNKFANVNTSFTLKVISIIVFIISFMAIFAQSSAFFDILLVGFVICLLVNSVKIVSAVKNIKQGKMYSPDYKLFNFPFNETFTDLQEISLNINDIVEKNVNAQKVKTELITNVSHDLRTPLTSIIGYLDLLDKKSSDYDEETIEYIKILDEKAKRMSKMVEDVFDISKSASGDVTLNFENLNAKKLIEQTLVELDDIVDEKLALKLEEDVIINADGDKMYRVLQNVIENAFKYSLEGTRIYIECFNFEDKSNIVIKNISNYNMDFTSEEILKRFKRGDESRTSKGSGLGLSIAQINTQLNNGEFIVDIDGDMFKVIISFNNVKI